MQNDEPKVVFIPANYKSGNSIYGFEIKTSNVLQGSILTTIPAVIGFGIIPDFIQIDPDLNLSIVTFFSFGLGYLGFVGINGQTLLSYIQDWLMFINMRMQDPKTAAVIIPERVRDKIGRYGNFFYAKGVMEWPF